jgi:hypothetical protein
LICIYFSESSEDESSEPTKQLCSTFALDGTGNVVIAQFNQKNNKNAKSAFVCVQ